MNTLGLAERIRKCLHWPGSAAATVPVTPEAAEREPGGRLERLASGKAFADAVPVGHALLAEAPAQLHHLTVVLAQEIDQPGVGVLEGDVQGFETAEGDGHRHLGRPQRRYCLGQLVLLGLAGAFAVGLELGDANAFVHLRERGHDVDDALDQAPYLRQRQVRLLDRVLPWRHSENLAQTPAAGLVAAGRGLTQLLDRALAALAVEPSRPRRCPRRARGPRRRGWRQASRHRFEEALSNQLAVSRE